MYIENLTSRSFQSFIIIKMYNIRIYNCVVFCDCGSFSYVNPSSRAYISIYRSTTTAPKMALLKR